jgi:hypothetical protein
MVEGESRVAIVSCRQPFGIQISARREAPDSLAMLKKGQRPHPAALAALVLIRHVALASLNSSQAAAPHSAIEDRSSLENLDRWLALALECTIEGNDAPASLKGWLDRARGPDDTDVPDSLLDQVNSFQTAVSYCFLRCCEAQLLINPLNRSWNSPNEDWMKRSLGSSKVRTGLSSRCQTLSEN